MGVEKNSTSGVHHSPDVTKSKSEGCRERFFGASGTALGYSHQTSDSAASCYAAANLQKFNEKSRV